MDMTPSQMGFAIGAAIGLIDYIILTYLGRKLVKQAAAKDVPPHEARKVEKSFKAMALISLILFPIIGYFSGPYILGEIT